MANGGTGNPRVDLVTHANRLDQAAGHLLALVDQGVQDRQTKAKFAQLDADRYQVIADNVKARTQTGQKAVQEDRKRAEAVLKAREAGQEPQEQERPAASKTPFGGTPGVPEMKFIDLEPEPPAQIGTPPEQVMSTTTDRGVQPMQTPFGILPMNVSNTRTTVGPNAMTPGQQLTAIIAEKRRLDEAKYREAVLGQRERLGQRGLDLQEQALNQPQVPQGEGVRVLKADGTVENFFLGQPDYVKARKAGGQILGEAKVLLSTKDMLSMKRDFVSESKAIVDTEKYYNAIQQVLPNARSAGDALGQFAVIYTFMKMLDPGSTVRETEAESVEKAKAFGILNGAGWIFDRTIDKLTAGTKLNNEQIAQIERTVDAVYEGRLLDQADRERQAYNFASSVPGGDPAYVVPNLVKQSDLRFPAVRQQRRDDFLDAIGKERFDEMARGRYGVGSYTDLKPEQVTALADELLDGKLKIPRLANYQTPTR